MNESLRGRWLAGLLALAPLLAASGTALAHEPPLIALDIKPQPLGDALNELAKQSRLQIVLFTQVGEGISAPTLLGKYTATGALDKLLYGTPLDYEFINPRTVAIEPKSAKQKKTSLLATPGMSDRHLLRLAQAEPEAAGAQRSSGEQPSSPSGSRDENEGARSDLAVQQVTVTARRREESLQTTPVAVTALSGDALTVRGAESVDALSQYVPNLQFDGAAALSGGAYNATIFIRGIGQNDFAIFSDPGAAMYIDGVYLGRSIGGIMDAVDLERVEVLRGPQGTLFGRNTIGGAVNIISKQPTDELNGELAATTGRFNRFDVHGTLNLPVSDRFLTRWTVARMTQDGYAKRLTDGADLGDKDALVGRAQALWKVSDDLNVSLTADGTRVRQNSAPLTLIDVTATGTPFLNLYNALVAPNLGIAAPNGVSTVNSSWITGDIDTTYAGARTVNDLDTRGAALTFDWNVGGLTVKSISAYRNLDALFIRDGDNTPFTYRETVNDDRQHQFSQELQLGGVSFDDRLTWLVGAYYFDEGATEHGKANLAIGTYSALEALVLPAGTTWCGLPGANPRPIASCPPPLRFGGAGNPNNVGVDVGVNLFTRVANESTAFFGQGTYKLTDKLSTTVGLRWTQDRKRLQLIHRREASGAYVVGAPGTQDTFRDDWSEVTPKLGFELQATPDAMFYASYAKGYKSGGFNGRPLSGIQEVLTPYDPETVKSYEVGAKTAWFERRMTANLALFYNDYKDMQLTINATPQNFVRNAGAAEIKGAELEIVSRLARGLDFNFSAGYLDAKYTELDPQLATLNPPLTLAMHLVKAPEWTLSSGLQYSFAAGTAGHITLRGDWSYKSKVYEDVFNDPRLVQPAFDLVNAYASFATNDERWEVAVFGTNLTDERYRLSGNSSIGFGLAESTFAAPREWGATLKYRF
ncbi:MAG TPA: TonB-dependent receptor [Steroidobacteraceae bacterium]|nr:TonB-dependent receptor [Steroidobacteraceae bacterium]